MADWREYAEEAKQRQQGLSVQDKVQRSLMNTAQAKAARATKDRSWAEATLGAATYGVVDTGGLVAARAGRFAEGLAPDGVSQSLFNLRYEADQFKNRHPEYAPIQVDNALELITNPKALAGQVSSSVPYMGATGLLSSIPYAGVPLAFGFTYAIENQSAYEQAKSDGATETQAQTIGEITGVVNGLIEFLQVGEIIKYAKGGKGALVKDAVEKTLEKFTASSATRQSIRYLATEGLQEALQGTVQEGTQAAITGQGFKEGFFDRRMQEIIGGVATASFFGAAGRALNKGLKPRVETGGRVFEPGSNDKLVELDVQNKAKMVSIGKEVWKLNDEQADVFATLAEKTFSGMSRLTGRDKQEFYNTIEQDPGGDLVGETLFQSLDGVRGFYSKLRKVSEQLPQEKWRGIDLLNFMLSPNKGGVSHEELEWTELKDMLLEKEKVTKSEVLQWLDEHEVQIDTVVLGKEQPELVQLRAERRELYSMRDQVDDAARKLKGSSSPQDQQKIEQLKAQREQIEDQLAKHSDAIEVASPRYSGQMLTLEGPKENYQEILIRVPQEQFTNMSGEEQEPQLSIEEHFPPFKNVVMHLRVDQRMSDKGSVFFVEEAQSTHHQTGKGQGYKGEEAKVDAKRQSLLGQITTLQTEIAGLRDRLREAREKGVKLEENVFLEVNRLIKDKDIQLINLSNELNWLSTLNPLPFTNWTELAAKRALMSAVEQGQQYIGWTPGYMQGERYAAASDQQKEGKNEFYDKVWPNTLLKVVRRYDKGAKIEEGKISKGPDNDVSIPVIRLSDEFKQRLALEGFSLFQKNKGSTTFLENGNAVFRALLNPDITTAMHELFHHVMRFLPKEDLDVLANAVGVKDGTWTKENHERAAKWWERYFREGHAPSGELQAIFARVKEWFKVVYRSIRQTIVAPIPTKVREIYDRMLVEDTEPVEAKRAELNSIELQLEDAQSIPDEVVKAEEVIRLSNVKGKLVDELRALQETRYTPRELLDREKLVKQLSSEADAIADAREQSPSIYNFRWAMDSLSRFVSMRRPLEKTQSGRKAIELIDKIENNVKNAQGLFEDEKTKVVTNLTNDDLRWLLEVDETGTSNLRSVVDDAGSPAPIPPPNDRIAKLKALFRDIDDYTTGIAKRLKVKRLMPDGSVVTIQRSKIDRLARVLTPDAWVAMSNADGPLYNAMVQAAVKLNPGLTMSQVEAEFKERFNNEAVNKKLGVLERSRKIKIMPDHVSLGGKWIEIMHTSPQLLLERSLETQVRRLGFIEYFGQGMLRAGGFNDMLKFAKIVGVDHTLKVSEAKRELEAQGIDVDLIFAEGEPVSVTKLRKIAQAYDVDLSLTPQQVINGISAFDISKLNGVQKRKLRAFAKGLKGVNTNDPLPQQLDQIRDRLIQDVDDNLIPHLRKAFVREGGQGGHFDDVMRLEQGLPFAWSSRNPFMRSAQLLSTLIGTAQTSTSALPNIAQTLVLVPQVAGLENWNNAVKGFFSDPETTRAQVVALGAFKRAIEVRGKERGYGMETFGRNVRQVVSKVTGLKWVSDMNNVIAAESFRLMAMDWAKNGMSSGDINVARRLKLTEEEIKIIQDGKLLATDNLFKKIVQQGVAKTQFTTEAKSAKGLIENIPLLNMVFAYSNYTMGMTRAGIETLKDIRDSLKNPERAMQAGWRLTLLLGGTLGAGAVTQILRQALRGQPPPPDDDEWWEKAGKSIAEVQFLGVTQRLLDPFRYEDSNFQSLIVSMSPQFSMLTKVLGSAFGYGRYGEFSLGKRVGEELIQGTPLVRGISNHVRNMAFPEEVQYKNARAAASHFASTTLGRKGGGYGDTPIEPEKYKVFEALSRGDLELAHNEARAYYKAQIAEGIQPSEAVRSLRSSLSARAPFGMLSEENRLRFLFSLPLDERKVFAKAQLRYKAMMNIIAPTFQ